MRDSDLYQVLLPDAKPGQIELKEWVAMMGKINEFFVQYFAWKNEEVRFYPTKIQAGSFSLLCAVDGMNLTKSFACLDRELADGTVAGGPVKLRHALSNSRKATENYGGFTLCQPEQPRPLVDVRKERHLNRATRKL